MSRRFLASCLVTTLAALAVTAPARAQSAPSQAAEEEDPLDTPDGKVIHTAIVRLDPVPGVTLEARVDGTGDWEPVCTAPCAGKQRIDAMYRVTGDDIRSSAPFRLATGENGRVDLHVRRVAKTPHTLGIVLTVVGGIGLGVGGIATLGAALSSATQCEGDNKEGIPCSPNQDGLIVGLSIGAAGLASLIGGLVLMGENQNTEVAQDIGSPTPEPGAQLLLPRRGEEERSFADASWRVGALESPKAFAIPLLGARF